MEQTRKKQFLLLQSGLLVALLTLLPSFGFVEIVAGVDLSIVARIAKLAAIIVAALGLFKLLGSNSGAPMPTALLVCGGLGLLITLVSIINTPMWLEIIGVILLFVALMFARGNFNIRWNSPGAEGAYLILLAMLLHIYNSIDGTLFTGLAALVGLILFLKGLAKLTTALDAKGIEGASKLKTAIILGIVGAVVGILPLLGWVGSILAIIAFIFEFLGYSALRESAAIGALGQKGAGLLRTSMLIIVIGVILGFIPFAGGTIEGLCAIAAIILAFMGWSNILFGIEAQNEQRRIEQAQ